MEEPLVIKALRDKRAEIHGQIAAYQAQIAQAKHDLAQVNATIRMFTDVECHARVTWSVMAFAKRVRLPIFAYFICGRIAS